MPTTTTTDANIKKSNVFKAIILEDIEMNARGRGQGGGGGRGTGGGGGGGGRGMGGNRPGSGPGGNCVCPKCGTKAPHVRGVPCYEQKCPNCSANMVKE